MPDQQHYSTYVDAEAACLLFGVHHLSTVTFNEARRWCEHHGGDIHSWMYLSQLDIVKTDNGDCVRLGTFWPWLCRRASL